MREAKDRMKNFRAKKTDEEKEKKTSKLKQE